MKLIILFYILISVFSIKADLFDTLANIENQFIKTVNDIKDTNNKIQFAIKNTIDVGTTAIKDAIQEAFDFSKVPQRVPVPDLIRQAGYPVEVHNVTTTDGYILSIHRIPGGKNGRSKDKVVYLQHGIMGSSADWVLFGPKHGLAYILADKGYDVWMGNVRGNVYSRKHAVLYPDTDAEYWQFSWSEMGIYDLPTMIDYILKQTQKKSLHFIGYSQGSAIFYVMASEKPDYNKKITVHISLAPLVYVKNTVSPLLKMLAYNSHSLSTLVDLTGQYEFSPDTGLIKEFNNKMCGESIGKVVCKNFLFSLVGYSPKQLNVSNLNLILSHYPASIATKQIIHYQQETVSGRFCQYDYGSITNKKIYNQTYPPPYDLSKVSTPVIIMYSSNDWLTHELDIDRLSNELGNLKERYLVPVPSWNHLDFIFGNDAPKVIYSKVVEYLEHY